MKKQIVLITESKSSDYTEYAAKLLESTDYEIIAASPDTSRYEAVVFVFDKEPYNTNDLLNSWVGHSHLRTVWGNSEKEKTEMLKKTLLHIAGIPAPLEIERKFLIEYPDITALEAMANCIRADIEQTYLMPIDGAHIRIRTRSVNNKEIYIKTEKKKITDAVRIETEDEITKEEHEKLMKYADPDLAPVRKTRYCLMDKGVYFEIDVFPFWKDKAYLEIELTEENEEFHIPDCINVLHEVTDDKRYSNRSLAKYIKENRTNEL